MIITIQKAAVRADKALLEALASQSIQITRTKLQALFHDGQILRHNQPIKSSMALPSGTELSISLPPPPTTDLVPENLPLTILYEDEYLVCINKPQNLSVHPSTTERTGTLVHRLLAHGMRLSSIAPERPGIVHRIDKHTSGVLVVAKDNATHLGLNQLFAHHTITRQYKALTYGAPLSDARIKLEGSITRNPHDRKKMCLSTRGKKAITYIQPEIRTHFASVLKITLETGRTHQIRLHTVSIKLPILGDSVYGRTPPAHARFQALPPSIAALVTLLPGQALHAGSLGFMHPITHQEIYVESEPPELFTAIENEIRRYA